jgi:Uma2 family endonuclease
MTLTATESKLYTAEEYFALEVESDTRSEFRNGEIVLMTGGTPTHNKIISAFNALLWFALRGKPYSIFMTDQRLWIPERNLYTYPDAMVIDEPLQLQPGRKDTVTNPILIAEILSDSTKAYDRDEKFEAYRTIATFQEYLLIDQYKPHVEHYVKRDVNKWLFTEYNGQDARIVLSSVSVEITLADLYENIEF